MADKGLRLEHRRLRGKSKVKILVAKQDDAAAKRSLSVRFFGISFEEIAMASLKEVEEMLLLGLIEEIIDEEEFVLLNEAYRPCNLPNLLFEGKGLRGTHWTIWIPNWRVIGKNPSELRSKNAKRLPS